MVPLRSASELRLDFKLVHIAQVHFAQPDRGGADASFSRLEKIGRPP